MPDAEHLEQLELRRQEISEAFSTVLEFLGVVSEMDETMPPGVYNYLWNKWFKLDGLKFNEEGGDV